MINCILYHEIDGVIFTYSTTDRATFLNIPEWMDEVKQMIPEAAVIVVGTTADLGSERGVSYCEGVQLAERLEVPFLETSAKKGTNMEAALYTLLALVGQGRFSTKLGLTRKVKAS